MKKNLKRKVDFYTGALKHLINKHEEPKDKLEALLYILTISDKLNKNTINNVINKIHEMKEFNTVFTRVFRGKQTLYVDVDGNLMESGRLCYINKEKTKTAYFGFSENYICYFSELSKDAAIGNSKYLASMFGTTGTNFNYFRVVKEELTVESGSKFQYPSECITGEYDKMTIVV